MTTVARHIPAPPGTNIHIGGAELIASLPENDPNSIDTSNGNQHIIKPPPDFQATASKSPTPPPVAKKPDRLKRKGAKPTPPPAPTRTSSISSTTISKFSNDKERETRSPGNLSSVSEVDGSSSLDKPNRARASSVSSSITMKINPTVKFSDNSSSTNFNAQTLSASYRSQTLRNRSLVGQGSGQESVTSNYSNRTISYIEGRRLHSSFSTSQPQLNAAESATLVKPKDRIRSILVGDSNDEGEQTIQDDYGSSYNTTLMKISHGDLQKHTVAVTMPIVPPAISEANKNRTLPPKNEDQTDGRNFEDSGSSSGNLNPRERAHTSPYHSNKEEPTQNAAAATGKSGEVNPLTMSDPIARAYRQHLMTKMEQSKKVCSVVDDGVGHISRGANLPGNHHREVNYTRSWDPANMTASGSAKPGTVAAVESVPLAQNGAAVGTTNMHNSVIYPQGNSAPAKQLSSSLGSDSGQTTSAMEQNGASQHGLSRVPMPSDGSVIRSGSPSILESVKFFEKAQTIAQGAGKSYGTMPRSRHYSSHEPSAKHGSEWKNKAKSIDNLSFSHDYEESESSTTPPPTHSAAVQRGFTPDLPHKDQNYYGNNSGSAVAVGEAWASNSLNVGQSSSSCSSSVGSCTPSPHAQQVNFPRQAYPTDGGNATQVTATMEAPAHVNMETTNVATEISTNGTQSGSKSIRLQARGPPMLSKPPAKKFPQTLVNTRVETISTESKPNQRILKENQFSFFDYISFHATQLPKRVKIIRAQNDDFNQPALSTGDVLDLHFVRKMKCIETVDKNGIPLVIPMNSAVTISMFYDPFNNEKMANLGFSFDTAGAIMDLKVPPIVVAAKTTVRGESRGGDLVKGEILVIQGVRTGFYGRLLKVVSLESKSVKHLDENCNAGFTTDPAWIKMPLVDIYEQSISLPQKAILHVQELLPEYSSESALDNIVTMKSLSITKSVVATSVLNQRATPESPLLDVAASVDIDIEEMTFLDEQRKVALQVTQNLLNSSAYKYAMPYLDSPDLTRHKVQLALIEKMDKTSPFSAEIMAPRDISLPASAKNTYQESSTKMPLAESSQQNDMDEKRLQRMEKRYTSLEATVLGMQSRLDEACKKVEKVFIYLNKAQTAMNQHKRLLSSRTDEPPKGRGSSTSKNNSTSDTICAAQDEYKSKSLPKINSVSFQKTPSLEDNDEVFLSKSSKPPLLPKPKLLTTKTAGNGKTNNAYNKLSIKRADSSPIAVSQNRDDRESGSSSILSTSSSTRQSVDLSEFLLPVVTETAKPKPAELKTREEDANTSIDGELDIANWCSQIEDELTQLYNESIMS